MNDKKIEEFIGQEEQRQANVINLIASENYVSRDVREALGSIFVNKYAEGYPGARYYGGNAVVDELESLVKSRALSVFGLSPQLWHMNVQPYSGSPANLAVYTALVPPGEKIMGLKLDMGGHLTHGHKVSATGKFWKSVQYTLDKSTEGLNYDEILKLAQAEKPKIIVAGYTAYPRVIDWKRMSEVAKSAGALLMVDMSHIAGLIAGSAYPSPFEFADIVTTTTHKTLRGPRSAMIFCKKEFASAIDRGVFPGLQGGPHENQIAAIGVALFEASQNEFKTYAKQVVANAKTLAAELASLGWRIISGGTDSHLLLVDTFSKNIGGKEASDLLEAASIIVNKNTIPYDTRSPQDPSGIRIGSPSVTTRGMKENDMKTVARLIDRALKKEDPAKIRDEVEELLKKFPLP